jgi:integrase
VTRPDEIVRCSVCGRANEGSWHLGRRCGNTAGGSAPCHGRWISDPGAPADRLAAVEAGHRNLAAAIVSVPAPSGPTEVLHGELLPVAGPRVTVPALVQSQAARDRTVLFADDAIELMAQGLAPNTWRAYRRLWFAFCRWCDEYDRTPLPVSLETLISYLTWMMRRAELVDGRIGYSPSTIRMTLAALKHFNGFGDTPDWPGSHRSVTKLVVGYEKEVGRDPERAPKRAVGARQAIMRELLDTCDPTTNRGACDRALLMLNYYLAARASEVANLTIADLRYTVDGLEVRIAYSKTDQTGQGTWVAVPANDVHEQYDPVDSVQRWIILRESVGITRGPLILPVRASGLIVSRQDPVSGQTIANTWARAVGEARRRAAAVAEETGDHTRQRLLAGQLTPHSGRRGFAGDARAAEWDLLDITRHGRWSPQSKAVHIYIEEIDKWLRHQTKPVRL